MGFLGSVVDVTTQEGEALQVYASTLIALYSFVYSARLKIDNLMGVFCTMCEKKFANVAAKDDMETVAAEFLQVTITTAIAVAATTATGGTAFPAVVGTLGGEVAAQIDKQFTEGVAESPAAEWSDIVGWYLDRQDELYVLLNDGLAEVGRLAKQVEDPQIGTVYRVEEQYLPTGSRHHGSGFTSTDSPAPTTTGSISSRLDGPDSEESR